MEASLDFLSSNKMMEPCLGMSLVLVQTAGLPSPCSLSAFCAASPSELQSTSFSGNKNWISL